MSSVETVTVILQARMSSKRLPAKVLSIVNDRPMLYWQIERVRKVRVVSKIIIATSKDQSDDPISEFATLHGYDVFRGDLDDVYQRYIDCIRENNIEGVIVRLTADCPLVMPDLLAQMLEQFLRTMPDYLSNTINPTYPDGLDIEICTVNALISLGTHNLSRIEREHVTYGFHSRQGKFRCSNYVSPNDDSNLRWTVDYPEDLAFVREVYRAFRGAETTFDFDDVMLVSAELDLKNPIPGNMRNISLRKQIGESK